MAFTQILFAMVIVGGIVAAMAINGYYKNLRLSRGQFDALEAEFRARLERLEALEERIAVLERIVTDRRFELQQAFRDLDKTG